MGSQKATDKCTEKFQASLLKPPMTTFHTTRAHYQHQHCDIGMIQGVNPDLTSYACLIFVCAAPCNFVTSIT
jgi:hypothetical protein